MSNTIVIQEETLGKLIKCLYSALKNETDFNENNTLSEVMTFINHQNNLIKYVAMKIQSIIDVGHDEGLEI